MYIWRAFVSNYLVEQVLDLESQLQRVVIISSELVIEGQWVVIGCIIVIIWMGGCVDRYWGIEGFLDFFDWKGGINCYNDNF